MCAIEIPGRGMRMTETLETNALKLSAGLADIIEPLLDKPFAFFGHSMGAMLAFEISLALKKRLGTTPKHLFASGAPAPQLPRSRPITYNLPEPELIEELRRLNGTPPELLDNPDFRGIMLPLMRADFSAVQTYTYQGGRLDCPVSVFGGLNDPEVAEEALAPWKEMTSGPFTRHMFTGDHFFLNTSTRLLCNTITMRLHSTAGDLFATVSSRTAGNS